MSEVQGPLREARSERSMEHNCGLTYRNRIRGDRGRTSEQTIAKSTSTNGPDRKSGRRAGKAYELTSGDLHCVPKAGLAGSQDLATAGQKSAEGVVGRVTSRVERPGGLTLPKARTVPDKGLNGAASSLRLS